MSRDNGIAVDLVSGYGGPDAMLPQFPGESIKPSFQISNTREVPAAWTFIARQLMQDVIQEIKVTHRSKSDVYISYPRYWERS